MAHVGNGELCPRLSNGHDRCEQELPVGACSWIDGTRDALKTTRIVATQLPVSCRIANLSSVASPMPPPCLMGSILPLELTSSFSTGVFPMSRASICSLSCANPA